MKIKLQQLDLLSWREKYEQDLIEPDKILPGIENIADAFIKETLIGRLRPYHKHVRLDIRNFLLAKELWINETEMTIATSLPLANMNRTVVYERVRPTNRQ